MKVEKRGNKSQISIELMLLLGISLVILISIISLGQKNLKTNQDLLIKTQSDAFLEEIVNSANLVYQQGYGSKTKAFVTLPENIKNITITDKTITIEFLNGEKRYQNLNFYVTGKISNEKGNQLIEIEAMKNFVIIAQNTSNLTTLNPSCGDQIKDFGEECDGSDLQGKNCTDFGFTSGVLKCIDCRYETNLCLLSLPENCNNMVDDDGDTFIDCVDPDCYTNPVCISEICANSIDDDTDGLTDCDDDECFSFHLCINEICSNHIDDDGDTFIDCNDSECTNETYCLEEICDNGADDDGDSYADCDDNECISQHVCISENCNNLIDDDGDLYTDCNDSECTTFHTCIEEICNNDIDDDGDSYIDCYDPECSAFNSCLPCDSRHACGDCLASEGTGSISTCSWCNGGYLGTNCYDSCKTGFLKNCWGGKCDKVSCS